MDNSKQPLYSGQTQFVVQPQPSYPPPQGYYVDPNTSHHVQVGYQQQTTTVEASAVRPINEEDANSAMLMFVIGFFFGIVWIVNYAMYRNSPNAQARQYAKFSLYAFIICLVLSVVLVIFSIVLPIIVVASAASTK